MTHQKKPVSSDSAPKRTPAATSTAPPPGRLGQIRSIALAWRHEAKLLQEADHPSADQILQIHGISRTLDKLVPVTAFQTRSTAVRWLLMHEKALGDARPAFTPRETVEVKVTATGREERN